MTEATGLHLGFDWSVAPPPPRPLVARVVDTTFGEWRLSTKAGKLDDSCLALLQAMSSIGIEHLDLGRLEVGDPELLRALVRQASLTMSELQLVASCDLLSTSLPVASDLADQTGRPLELGVEFASPRLRAKVDGWQLHDFLDYLQAGVATAVSAGLPVNGIIDDATQTAPDVLAAELIAVADSGASRITLSDRRGLALPAAVGWVIPFARSVLLARRFAHVPIEWDGHSVKGAAAENALLALSRGADRVVAAALGAGQGASRAAVESIAAQDLSSFSEDSWQRLRQYSQAASKLLELPTAPSAKPTHAMGRAAN